MARNCLLLCIAFSALAGCDEAALLKRFVPPGDERIAEHYVDLLRTGNFEPIEHDLDPSIKDPTSQNVLAQMAAIFPDEAPQSVKVVGVHVFNGQGYSTTDISLEYQFKNKWLLANVATKKKGGDLTVLGFHVNPISDSLENLNRFTLVGKDIAQYIILTLGLGSLGFSLYVLGLCIRTKNIRVKWLWILLMLVGVGRLAVNWTTGDVAFTPLALQIPCLAATRPFYGPWTVAAYLPAVAILFLSRHRKPLLATSTLIDPPADGPK